MKKEKKKRGKGESFCSFDFLLMLLLEKEMSPYFLLVIHLSSVQQWNGSKRTLNCVCSFRCLCVLVGANFNADAWVGGIKEPNCTLCVWLHNPLLVLLNLKE